MATIPRDIQSSASSNIQNAQSSAASNIQNAQATATNISDQQQQRVDDLQKAADDKVNYLKDQAKQSSKDIKAKLAAIITPVLLQFIRAENIADVLIKKLEKETKKQFQNKGILTINNGVITFTPSNKGNYDIFKQNFDKKKASLEKTINTLKKTLDTLQKVLTFINLGLSLLKILIKIKVTKKTTQQSAIKADLASSSPVKTSGLLIVDVDKTSKDISKTEKKIETYQAVITAINVIIPIFKDMLSKLQIKINQLQFIINSGENSSNNINNINNGVDVIISDINNVAPEESEYVNSSGKLYILKLITLPNGAIQYQALDSFSKLKITQTAPSKIATADELFDEIKQILG